MYMMTSSNWNNFRVIGPLCGESVNFPRKGQWRGALMFSSICGWINGWVNNRYAGDLRRHHAHYDVTVMIWRLGVSKFCAPDRQVNCEDLKEWKCSSLADLTYVTVWSVPLDRYQYASNIIIHFHIQWHGDHQHEDITVTSLWARWRLKSPASRLFARPFVQAQIKENTKSPRHWPLRGNFTGDRWIPRTKGQ